MAVTFIGAGALAVNATVATQAIATHASTAIDDILIAQVINKGTAANAISPPDGTWTEIIDAFNDATTTGDHQYALFWKKATVAGAASHTFTKATDDNSTFGGVISSWRGAEIVGTPLDPTAVGATATVANADNVSFPAYDPTRTNSHIIFMAFYGDDLTTFAAAMSGDTNPDCTIRYDLESSTGTDCTLACTSGDTTDGANIASRTWASASTADAANTGVVFALQVPQPQTLSPNIFYDDGILSTLLHCEGADGSQTFTDETGLNTYTTDHGFGIAEVDTAQFKFGTSSFLLNGGPDIISSTTADGGVFAWGSVWTLDFWVRLSSVAAAQVLVCTEDGQPNGVTLQVEITASAFIRLVAATVGNLATGTAALSANTWHHIAVTCDGTDIRSFVDGTLDITYNSQVIKFDARRIRFGRGSGVGPMTGWLDEIRVIKGKAVWTAGFTPPTAAYTLTDNIGDTFFAPTIAVQASAASMIYNHSANLFRNVQLVR
jgi:hypothetical protein